jgi:hypothetical protein
MKDNKLCLLGGRISDVVDNNRCSGYFDLLDLSGVLLMLKKFSGRHLGYTPGNSQQDRRVVSIAKER